VSGIIVTGRSALAISRSLVALWRPWPAFQTHGRRRRETKDSGVSKRWSPLPLRAPAGDPTPITQVKVRTRAKSITGFSLSKPVSGFKTGYRFSGSRLTFLNGTQSTIITGENHSLASVNDQYGASGASLIYLSSNIGYYHNYGYNTDLTVNSFIWHQNLASDRNYFHCISSWKLSASLSVIVTCQ